MLDGAGISALLMALEPCRGELLYPAVGLVGGLVLPLYAVCIAQANDRLKPGQIVAASGTLVLLLNAGIVLGPMLSAAAITTFGPNGLFLLLVVIQGATALVAVTRLLGRRALVEEQGVAPAVSQYGTPVAARLNPEAGEVAPR